MDTKKAQELLAKHEQGTLTPDEQALLDSWYIQLAKESAEVPQIDLAGKQKAVYQRLIQAKTRALWPRLTAAAAILIILSFGAYFISHKPAGPATNKLVNDIAPGGNKAILTLSNGQKIILNGKSGLIANQAGKQIVIGKNGEIAYTGEANSEQVIYNTLTVPIGNSRELVLPDGTEVSLDAGSSITYPVVFTADRKVSVTGQAYFTVKHDESHPFITSVKGVVIKDIGTEFNIDAYDAVKTTLISGSVKVDDIQLKPGQQIQDHTITNADLDAVTAWKNNDFYFDNQSLRACMQQIARWYNVDVVYKNVDDRLKLFVDVTRSTNLSVVLKAIENTGKVKCSLEGHTITLSN